MPLKIKKILNNNAVVIIDQKEEKIAIGTGIAFQKKKNDIVNPSKIEKLFVLKENERFHQLLLQIPEEHFVLSEEIITYAEQSLGTKLSEHIHIALTDHLSFAIERIRDGMYVKNKLLQEIKMLYKKEFNIGQWAIKHIEKRMNITFPIDEAGYIALHIHTAKLKNGDMKQTLRQTTILSHMIQTIRDHLKIEMNEDDLSYQRLITHLRFAISRINANQQHTMDEEMLKMIKIKFPASYDCAKKIATELLHHYQMVLPEHELGYVTLHIERLRKK
ncbi:PRD domain-containing protein [Neobacillus sedimentimangrovi]|uniref:PRD domain-containing protein n=1 Tax=Neobacillus sedimentimangrovi TaxID=2699460 RepID=UPI0032C4A97A